MRTAAVDHDRRVVSRTRFGDRVCGFADVLGSKVWTFGAATEDNVHVLISTRLDDRSDALFRDAHERVRVTTRAHRVNCDRHAAVSAILEPDREGYARGEFTMKLRFGGACADCAPRNKIIKVLW
jgi:hypothetical protein